MVSSSPFRFSPNANSAAEIPWREWDAEVFEAATASDRPVLLSLAAGWAPSSHAFDESLFSDERVAFELATNMIPLRVDIDERPDVAVRYGEPGQPCIAILTPAGEPMECLVDPTADELLQAIEDAQGRWAERREGLGSELGAGRDSEAGSRRGELTPSLLDIALELAETSQGPARGPAAAEVVRLWLYAHRRRADVEAELRARRAIQRRVDGGGVDRESGAFRHCVAAGADCDVARAGAQGEWLEVLARIASEDSEAHEWAFDVVERVIRYLERELMDGTGGFRDSRGDDRVFSAANAAVARGLLACGVVFNRSDWRSRGRTVMDFIIEYLRAGEAGVYHVWDGAPRQLGLLADQVACGEALLDAYEVTGEADFLAHAQAQARVLERQFRETAGALRDVDAMHETTALLAEPRAPLAENARGAELMVRLGHLTHDDRYPDAAYSILGALAGGVTGEAEEMEGVAALARVADRLLSLEAEVKVVSLSRPTEFDTVADPLHREALRLALSAHTVQRLHVGSDDQLIEQLGLTATAAGSSAGAVCFVNGEYGPLLTHPDELLPSIERQFAAPSF
jgi:uncharacterized protein